MKSTIVIDIDDFVGFGNASFKEVKKQIKSAKGKKVRAVVNGYGGMVTDGIGIYNLLRGHDAATEVHIPAWAMSADTIIAMGADNTTMADNGFFMVHNPMGGAYGEAEEMEHTAGILRMMEKQLVDIYARKTKLGKKKIKDLMNAETWLSADEALKLGFVDALTEGAKITNHFDAARFPGITPPPFTNQSQKKSIMDNPFLNRLKEFFNIQNDAPQTEVEAILEEHGTLENYTTAMRTQIEGELQDTHQQEIDTLTASHEAALEDVTIELTQTKNALNAANTEIATLKDNPAAGRTAGKTTTPTNDGKEIFAGTITEKAANQLQNTGKKKLPFA